MRLWIALVLGLALLFTGKGLSEGLKPPPLEAAHATLGEQLARGDALYAFHCSTCHGRQGGGLGEARTAFPEDHRFCERCHAPGNPRQLAQDAMTPDYAFSVGLAPPLWGEGALERFTDASALYAYSHTAMPRQAPGSLKGDDYLDLVAFILARNEWLPHDEVLGEMGLEALLLVP